MPYALDILSGAAHPAVTNVRATDDYFHPRGGHRPKELHGSYDQWALGASSLLLWALGYLPFKDGFYSSSRPQTGGQTVGPEHRPRSRGSHCI